MPSQKQLEKSAWEWAEITKPADITENNVETAYRLHFDRCQEKICSVNCIGNPWCLCHLSKRRWLDENFDIGELIPAVEIQTRDQDAFIGLKKLGATCYLNAFLQLWYHNRSIRRAFLLWKDASSTVTTGTESESAKVSLPSCLCEHLQLIFAGLSFSDRSSFDTQPLVDFLDLDTSLQQDCNEFALLLKARLEDFFSRHPDKSVQRAIEQQFRGQQSYTTTCAKCGTESKHNERFLELVLIIENRQQLQQCIDDYLKAEQLTQDNKYQCPVCGTKEDAMRYTELVSLPPVLNILLSRFQFDRESGRRIKLNNVLEFPDVLDMTKYAKTAANDGEEFSYKLFSILYHEGMSATQGHYIAIVRDPSTHIWYKYNDNIVTKVGTDVGRTLIDSDEAHKPLPKKPKMDIDVYKSRDVYMLAYHRCSSDEGAVEDVTLEMLPTRVQEFIKADNMKCKQEADQQKQKADSAALLLMQRQSTVKKIWSMIQSDNDLDQIEFISAEWLIEFLDAASDCEVKPVNNSCLLCPHNLMSPENMSQAKIISSRAATALFAKYGGDVRLPSKSSMCIPCVADKCRAIFAKNELQEGDSAMMPVPMFLENISLNYFFWVSKTSFARFVELDMRQVMDVNSSYRTDLDNSTAESAVVLNQDITCPHGKLSADVASRRLVDEYTWKKLTHYFPNCIEYTASCRMCDRCESGAATSGTSGSVMNDRQKIAESLLSTCPDILSSSKRPILSAHIGEALHVISIDALNCIQGFIRDPVGNNSLTSVSNKSLLCRHAGVLFTCDLEGGIESDKCALISNDEWCHVTKYFTIDHPITVTTVVNEDGDVVCELNPPTCFDCIDEQICQEMSSCYIYDAAPLYLKINDSSSDQVLSENINVSSCVTVGNIKSKLCEKYGGAPTDIHMYNGKEELVDENKTLGALEIKPGATLTVKIIPQQAMVIDDDDNSQGGNVEGFRNSRLTS